MKRITRLAVMAILVFGVNLVVLPNAAEATDKCYQTGGGHYYCPEHPVCTGINCWSNIIKIIFCPIDSSC